MYSKILLIWLARDRAGSKLLIIPDYQTVCILTYVLTVNFLLLPLYLSCTTNHRSISFGYLFIRSFRFVSSTVFSGDLIVEEVDGTVEGGQEIPQRLKCRHSWRPLWTSLNMSVWSACFTDDTFSWQKAKLLVLGLLSSSAELSKFPY